MIVGRTEAGQKDPCEEHDGCWIVTKPSQPCRADSNKGKIRDDVPEVRYAEDRALVGELVIALVLRDRRQQEEDGK